MRQLLAVVLLSLTISCSKKDDDSQIIICTGPDYPSWLIEKTESLSSCVCETAILIGTYKNQQVVEQRLVAPLCNGINVIYSYSGSVLFTSQNQQEYNKYRDGVAGLQEIWRCSSATAQ